jgi:hypothetical protein
MTTDDFLSAASDFNLLSLRDLLAASDQFHLHLINKPHVVATAVGRYRIRIDEPWSTRQNPMGEPAKSQKTHPKRTLSNSEIRPNSWPAILVFVDNWIQVHDLAHPKMRFRPLSTCPTDERSQSAWSRRNGTKSVLRATRTSTFPRAQSGAAIRSFATCKSRSISPRSRVWLRTATRLMPSPIAMSLETLYQNPQFLPSKTLDQIGSILKGGPAPAPAPTKPKRKAKPSRSTKR